MVLLTAGAMAQRVHSGAVSRVSTYGSSLPPASSGRESRRVQTMRRLLEITADGDILDDGETYPLFPFDPESLSDDVFD
jgi:hypothetical protein